jgi:hypothetical protein
MKFCQTIALAGSALLLAAPVSASSLSCPETIDAGIATAGAADSFKFRYVSFFDGDPSEMADLAPDDGANPKVLEQRWQFTRAPERPIYMVCRYHGTDETVKKEVPADVKQCRLGGLVSEQGEVVGSPSLECD